jgi:hypothetical protein
MEHFKDLESCEINYRGLDQANKINYNLMLWEQGKWEMIYRLVFPEEKPWGPRPELFGTSGRYRWEPLIERIKELMKAAGMEPAEGWGSDDDPRNRLSAALNPDSPLGAAHDTPELGEDDAREKRIATKTKPHHPWLIAKLKKSRVQCANYLMAAAEDSEGDAEKVFRSVLADIVEAWLAEDSGETGRLTAQTEESDSRLSGSIATVDLPSVTSSVRVPSIIPVNASTNITLGADVPASEPAGEK